MDGNGQRAANWLQFAILLVTIIGIAIHEEGRLAKVEQALTDEEKASAEMVHRIERIELRLDHLRH